MSVQCIGTNIKITKINVQVISKNRIVIGYISSPFLFNIHRRLNIVVYDYFFDIICKIIINWHSVQYILRFI